MGYFRTSGITGLAVISYKGKAVWPKELASDGTWSCSCCYIAKDMQPYSIVESPGFRMLVSKLSPRYKLPSQKYFTQHEIPSLYTSVKESTVNPKLAEIEFYAATTDLWTSKATHPYLGCTVHFIDHSWELQLLCMYSKILSVQFESLCSNTHITLLLL